MAETHEFPFDTLAESMERMALEGQVISNIAVLAIEYEAKTIDAFRFSQRVLELLKAHSKSMNASARGKA